MVRKVDVLPGMNAGASTSAVPSPIEGSGTAWVLLGSWALSPARPTPIHPRPERRGFSALLVIVGKIYGKDIRSHGSKSAGLTNTLRVLGKSAAVFVLAGDILKGIIACFIGLFLGVYFYSGEAKDCASLLAAGAGAVIGHNWPVYFGFKGGKGVLTAVSVLFMFDWVMALLCLGFFVIIVAFTRYVSLGSICATMFFWLFHLFLFL